MFCDDGLEIISYLCNMAVMHIDEVKRLAQSAHQDEKVREDLFREALADDGRRSSQAAWVLTHLPADDNVYIDAHREELLQVALSTEDTSLRRISLVLLERLEWADADVRLLDFSLDHMMRSDEPYGVRSLCMKLAYAQCRHYPELKEELRQALLLIEPSEIGAGVRHTRKKILEVL